MSKTIIALAVAALLLTGTVSAALAGPATTETTMPQAQELLTEAAAAEIALAHAAVTDPEGLRTTADREDGIEVWDVEFRDGDWEYDYTIHAQTGAVLEWDREYEPRQTTPAATEPAPAVTEPIVTEPAPPVTEPAAKALTQDEAIAAALAHAAVTAPENLRAKTDWDDGVEVWEVEFRYRDWEYDYTIHAQTGNILEWDRDYEPKKTTTAEPAVTEPPATTATEPAAKTLTKDEAIQIALAHAGLTADQVQGLRAHLDDDDRTPEWEVEFRADRMEYEYSIHAESGKILEWEKELDD